MFYVVQEDIPAGWTVKDNGGGMLSGTGRILTWMDISSPVDTTYTYTITAPPATGSYDFSGSYTMGSMLVHNIAGDTQVVVQ